MIEPISFFILKSKVDDRFLSSQTLVPGSGLKMHVLIVGM